MQIIDIGASFCLHSKKLSVQLNKISTMSDIQKGI